MYVTEVLTLTLIFVIEHRRWPTWRWYWLEAMRNRSTSHVRANQWRSCRIYLWKSRNVEQRCAERPTKQSDDLIDKPAENRHVFVFLIEFNRWITEQDHRVWSARLIGQWFRVNWHTFHCMACQDNLIEDRQGFFDEMDSVLSFLPLWWSLVISWCCCTRRTKRSKTRRGEIKSKETSEREERTTTDRMERKEK